MFHGCWLLVVFVLYFFCFLQHKLVRVRVGSSLLSLLVVAHGIVDKGKCSRTGEAHDHLLNIREGSECER